MDTQVKNITSNNPHFIPTAQWCLEKVLQQVTYDINIAFHALRFSAANCLGCFIPPNQIHIDQMMERDEKIRAIFHELKHYHQFLVKPEYFKKVRQFELQVFSNPVEKYFAYLNLPWELEASEFAMETWRMYSREKGLLK